jgi:Diguanylate cyclase, GGDEF domain
MFRNTGISGQFQNKPELPALHQLLSQALENRGKQMQIIWRTPTGAIFTLIVICNMRGDPRWCLYCEQKGKRDLLFDYSSCDVILVNNLITSSCAEAQKSGKSIFAGGPKSAAKQPPEQAPVVENFSPDPPSEAIEPRDVVAPTDPLNSQGSISPTDPVHSKGQAIPNDSKNPLDTPDPLTKPSQSSASTSFQPAAADQELPFAVPSRYTAPSATGPVQPPPSLVLSPRSIDADAIQTVMTSLRNKDTGMFMTSAFLYFLEQEYFRSLRSRSSLSVILFDIREEGPEDGNMVRQKLPPGAMVDAVMRITELKRHVDVLAHYDEDSYALLLPHTKAAGARTFANRLIRSLTEKPLGRIDASRLAIAVGCSSIPEDFVDLSKLLGAADLTLSQARKNRVPLVMFSDIKNTVTVPQ